jgi:hypothetical protein
MTFKLEGQSKISDLEKFRLRNFFSLLPISYTGPRLCLIWPHPQLGGGTFPIFFLYGLSSLKNFFFILTYRRAYIIKCWDFDLNRERMSPRSAEQNLKDFCSFSRESHRPKVGELFYNLTWLYWISIFSPTRRDNEWKFFLTWSTLPGHDLIQLMSNLFFYYWGCKNFLIENFFFSQKKMGKMTDLTSILDVGPIRKGNVGYL